MNLYGYRVLHFLLFVEVISIDTFSDDFCLLRKLIEKTKLAKYE